MQPTSNGRSVFNSAYKLTEYQHAHASDRQYRAFTASGVQAAHAVHVFVRLRVTSLIYRLAWGPQRGHKW